MSSALPSRHMWAATCLEPQPTDRILEVGIGGGHAASIILPLLTAGTYIGIDQSATAIARASATLTSPLRSGVVALRRSSLEAFSHSPAFNRILAINVNTFWLKPESSLPAARNLLTISGSLVLVFEPPSYAQFLRAQSRLVAGLMAEGFESVQVRTARLRRGPGFAIRARTPAA